MILPMIIGMDEVPKGLFKVYEVGVTFLAAGAAAVATQHTWPPGHVSPKSPVLDLSAVPAMQPASDDAHV